jgi:PAS domain S-box-containing protein
MPTPEWVVHGFPPVDLATLDLLPDPAWITGSTSGMAYFNAAWLTMTGTDARAVSSEDFLARVHPDDRAALQEEFRVAFGAQAAFAAQYRIRRGDGEYHWFLMRAVPVDRDGALGGWMATIIDVDAERRATDELVASEARARSIADAIPQLIGVTAPDGRLMWVNDSHIAYTGKTIDEIRDAGWADVIHPDDVDQLVSQWTAAVASGEPYDTQYRLRRHDGVYRWFINKAKPVRDPSGAITAWIGALTDIDERQRAENALRVVVEAASAFAGTLDASVALQRLAEIAASHIADWCGVYVYDAEDRLRPVAIAHHDPAKVRFVRDYLRRFPVRDGDAATLVASTGVSLRVDEITPEMYDVIENADQRAFAKSLGLHSILYVPLAAEDERYGVLNLATAESGRRFTAEDEQLAGLIAQRAAIAVGNARLYERQREVARTLQASFLPPMLPALPDASFDAVYAPGTRDLTVGGDWYDAFAYDGDLLGFSVGDVAGRGLDAAVPMGKMRQTFRALAVVERDPARALVVADSVLRREHPTIFVTAFVATYDRRTRALRYANAGHPAPIVREPDGTLTRLEAAGIPLGLMEFDTPRTVEGALAQGALFVAFTDGLIESTHDIDEGEARVAAALAHPAFAICSTPAALLCAMTVPTLPNDDVAILTLRAGGGADWSFDANDRHAAQAAREAFVARLVTDGVNADDRVASEIIFGETIGNVARYTPGRIDLGLHRDGGALVFTALDRGPGFPWNASPPQDTWAESGRGLFLIQTLARAVHVEHLLGFGTYLAVTLPG